MKKEQLKLEFGSSKDKTYISIWIYTAEKGWVEFKKELPFWMLRHEYEKGIYIGFMLGIGYAILIYIILAVCS